MQGFQQLNQEEFHKLQREEYHHLEELQKKHLEELQKTQQLSSSNSSGKGQLSSSNSSGKGRLNSGQSFGLQQQPPIGIDPQNVFSPPMGGFQPLDQQQQMFGIAPKLDNHVKTKSRNSTCAAAAVEYTGQVYLAVYSGVSVYEMQCRNVAVMRREKDSFLNATQVLKVANIDKGKRTKILEREIQNKEHEKVQGGYGKYQGTWIPFQRGIDLARQFGVDELLRPLFEYQPAHGEKAPSKEQVHGRSQSRRNPSHISSVNVTTSTNSTVQTVNVGTQQTYLEPVKRMKMDSAQTYVESPDLPSRDNSYLHGGDIAFGEQLFEFDSHHASHPQVHPHHYADTGYFINPYATSHAQFGNSQMIHVESQPPIALAAEPASERHRSTIMALFLNNANCTPEEFFSSPLPSDFDIDLVLDDQGHTALHWAAALANVRLMPYLLNRCARLDVLNFMGETPLVRSVMVGHNYDYQTFADVLSMLKDTIAIPDKKSRTVLHHICLSASVKTRVNAGLYYMKCIREFYAKSAYDEAVSSEMVHSDNKNSLSARFQSILNLRDVCGDTAVNIASRVGNKILFDMLVEAGADVSIPNFAGLCPADYGFGESKGAGANTSANEFTTILYPSIKNDQENSQSSENQVDTEKTKAEMISEMQNQLVIMARDLAEYRKVVEPLQTENAEIPALKSRIQALEKALSEKKKSSDYQASNSPVKERIAADPGAAEEILRLREGLAHQKGIVAKLCQELQGLRRFSSKHESFCKRIISECCHVPLESVDEILQPLLEVIETDLVDLDLGLVQNFIAGIQSSKD